MVNHKNFNAILFTGCRCSTANKFITYCRQSNLERFIKFCNRKYTSWAWITIYDRKTNEKELIKNTGNYI